MSLSPARAQVTVCAHQWFVLEHVDVVDGAGAVARSQRRGGHAKLHTNLESGAQAVADCLAMQQVFVTSRLLKGVTEGVAKIETHAFA
jgi:hypothetical protein